MSKDLEVMKPVIAGALSGSDMDRHAIKSRALRHGFTLRPQEGRPDDLNEYVYSFAREVFEAGRKVGEKDRDALTSELERERLRLAACGVVAMADTPDSAREAREMHPDYKSASCDDVARRVDECMALRQERDALAAELERLRAQDSADAALISAAEAVIARWESPGWKDLPPTADSIAVLRRAVLEAKAGRRVEPVNARLLDALKHLSFCAQTTGGTAGRDDGLIEAVERAAKAIAAAEAQQAEPVRLMTEYSMAEAVNETAIAQQAQCGYPSWKNLLELCRAIESAVLRANGLLPADGQAKNGD